MSLVNLQIKVESGTKCKVCNCMFNLNDRISIINDDTGTAFRHLTCQTSQPARVEKWMENLDADFIEKAEWYVMLVLKKSRTGDASLSEIASGLKLMMSEIDRSTVRDILSIMVNKGLLSRINTKTKVTYLKYERVPLSAGYYKSHEAEAYFDYENDYQSVYMDEVRDIVINDYLDKNMFIYAMKYRPVGINRIDFIAYDYDRNISIAVNVESSAEVHCHQEHVLKNMMKWQEMGFDECHVWSENNEIREIMSRLNQNTRENVRAYVIHP